MGMPVTKRRDWEHQAQSSEQRPDLALMMPQKLKTRSANLIVASLAAATSVCVEYALSFRDSSRVGTRSSDLTAKSRQAFFSAIGSIVCFSSLNSLVWRSETNILQISCYRLFFFLTHQPCREEKESLKAMLFNFDRLGEQAGYQTSSSVSLVLKREFADNKKP